MRTSTALAAAAAAVMVAADTLPAATIGWSGGAGGTGTTWNSTVNWSGGVIPGSNDVAEIRFPVGAPNKTISLDAPQAVFQLSFPNYGNEPVVNVGTTNDVAAGNTLTLSSFYRGDNVGNMQTIAATVVLATNSVWDVRPGYNNGVAVSGAISGDGVGLSKWGNGTLWLQGANPYTGDTILNAGILRADFNTSGGPVTNILSSASRLLLNGGTFILKTKDSATRSQALDNLVLNNGAATLNIESHASGNARLTFGAISRNPGATLNLVQPTGKTTITADNGYTTDTPNNGSGILGPYLTVSGADWAANNGVNIVAYTSYTDLAGDSPVLGDSPGTHVRVNTGSTGTVSLGAGTVTIETLLVKDPAGRTVSIGSGNTLRLGASGGILVPSGSARLLLDEGTLTAGGADNTPGEIIFFNSVAVTNSAVIADNGSGAVTLTKAAGGLLALTTAPTHTGGTYLNAGTLLLPAVPNPLPGNALLSVNGGTLNLNGMVQTNSGAVIVCGGIVTNGTIVKEGSSFDIQGGTIASALSGTSGLEKTSMGIATLHGANKYTGLTVVREGSITFSGNNIVNGNVVIGTPDGPLPVSANSVGAPYKDNIQYTVYRNGTLNFGSSAQSIRSTVTLYGGTVRGSQIYANYGTSIQMTGGSMEGGYYISDFTIASHATSATATVSASLTQNHTFNVEDGEAPVDLQFSGGFGSGKTLTKTGTGTMAITGSRTSASTLQVNSGTLLVNNTANAAFGNSPVNVGAATLGGTGFLGGAAGYGNANVTLTGTGTSTPAILWPGTVDPATGAHLTGALTVGDIAQTNNVTFGANSRMRVAFDEAGYDRLVVNGTVNLSGLSDSLELVVPEDGLKNGTYTLVSASNEITGEFETVSDLPERTTLVYGPTEIQLVVRKPSGALIIVQ